MSAVKATRAVLSEIIILFIELTGYSVKIPLISQEHFLTLCDNAGPPFVQKISSKSHTLKAGVKIMSLCPNSWGHKKRNILFGLGRVGGS